MKDEIKERIKYFKHYVVDNLSLDAQDDFQNILDYITNLQQKEELLRQEINDVRKAFNGLQQENERLKELNENASKVCISEHRYGVEKAEEARDYKSRCEKALEINKKLQNIGILDSRAVLWLSQQENILNGGDEE